MALASRVHETRGSL